MDLLEMAASIVAANVYGQGCKGEEVSQQLQEVHRTLTRLQEAPHWQDSIQQDSVTCLLCGAKVKVLALHLRRHHHITCQEYRGMFQIPAEVSLVAATLSQQRRQQAIDLQLASRLRR